MMPETDSILVVEDEAGTRVTLSAILKDAGYDVTGLEKGAEAQEMLRNHPFNVIITDIRLPDVGGSEILELAKEINPDAAVIMMTGYASIETAINAVNEGAYAYFVKPINPDEIKSTITNALKQQKLSIENKRLVDDLQQSNSRLLKVNEEVQNEITERKQVESALNERVKELQCLYSVAYIAERPGVTFDEMCQEVVNLLPTGWQYPELTCARVTLGDKEFKTDDFKITEWKRSANINVNGQKEGTVEVYYLEARPELDEWLFLKEERLLLDVIADRLGRITERIQAERELQEKNEQLDAQNEELQSQTEELIIQQQEIIEKTGEVERANQLKSEFLANMSHELRTPLNVIIGFSELMRDEITGKISEEQRQCLNDILASGQHLLSLINEVLDLSRVESGTTKLNLTDFALTEVIEVLARTVLPVLAPRQHSLDVEMEEDLPLVHADKSKVREVLLNLLSNATKFTPDGGRLKIEAIKEGNWCRVSVIDNGIGIKKEDQERIFEPFYQLDNNLTRERTGTGLGLTLVKQIIEKHGGQVWVESEYGKGSRFIFALPLAKTD